MITNLKIARSLLVPISSIINACFCCSEDKKLRGFTFANCKSLLWEEGDEKNLRHCRNRFSKMIFQTSWNEESRHNNEHLILQKLTLDPFKQGFILVLQFQILSSKCNPNCDWLQIGISKKAKMCLKIASLITILHCT